MDVPNFKDILQKLSILKSNMSLLASIIITLVALLLFIPARLWSSSLKERVRRTSVSVGNRIRSELQTAGSREQPKEVAKREAVYAKDAKDIATLAIESTQRELLSYDIFPAPNDTSVLIFKMFGQRFQEGIDAQLTRVNANDCPTDVELDRGVRNASGDSSVGRGRSSSLYSAPSRSLYSAPSRSLYSAPSRSLYSAPSRGRYDISSGMVNDVAATIREEICLDRAKSCSVYANPTYLAGYEFWGEYKYDVNPEDAIKDCWFYQLGYWVIEDVLDTIGAMNSASSNVLTAPVKRLIGVSFTTDPRNTSASAPSGYQAYSRPRRSYIGTTASKEAGDKPAYVSAEKDGLTESCTARLGNDDIDVIHFNVAVVVGVKSVLPFMKELCSTKQHKFKGSFDELAQAQVFTHNQITVLESKFRSVDRMEPTQVLYRYGADAVVELDLVCEYVFNKKAYDAIKPEMLKGVPEQAEQQQSQWR
ncbi:MAG: hypothetical protein KAY65_14765 [Planctomycetes bacterium]|nr:hypothetical protein [Planctomycetota bacterium]